MLFEVGALAILVPLLSTLLHMDFFHFGALAVALSLCAMGCNMVYNHLFEALESRFGWQRTIPVRVGHSLGFELFFMLIALPLTAWWLSMSLWEALMLDLVFSVFFVLYAFVFNWIYDIVRKRLQAG